MIDPVRFLSNRSTGVMGYEIAKAAKKSGHNVTLISGPVNIKPPEGVKFIKIVSVEELKKATLLYLKKADCLFMSAAVSDWRVARLKKEKIKRAGKELRLILEPTPDILAIAGKKKGKRILVGFSIETTNALANAKEKLRKKNLDLIVVNRLDKTHDPFGDKDIRVFIVNKAGGIEKPAVSRKKDIAQRLIDKIERLHKWGHDGGVPK